MIRTPEEQYLHELIESYVAPLRSEIKELKQQLSTDPVKDNGVLPIVMPSAFIAEDENNENILVFAETLEQAEKKLEKEGIESYMLRYLIKPDKVVH